MVLQLLEFDYRDWIDDPTGPLLLMISSSCFLQFPYCATVAEKSAELGVDGSLAQDVRSLSSNCSSNWSKRRN